MVGAFSIDDVLPATRASKCCCTTLPQVVTLSTKRTRCGSALIAFLCHGLSAYEREMGALQPYMRGLKEYAAATNCDLCWRVTLAVIITPTGSCTFWLTSHAPASFQIPCARGPKFGIT